MLTQTYYTRREIIDFKDLISQSTAIYGNKNAFLIDGVMGEKTGITYKVRGTVKEHSVYKNVKQTILTRCKCEEVE